MGTSKTPNWDLLKLLAEEDLNIIVSDKNLLDKLLSPIKHNSKHFKQQTFLLGGKLDSSSELVQKRMPKLAVELYHKNEEIYIKIFAEIATSLKNVLEGIFNSCFSNKVNLAKLTNLTEKQYRRLFLFMLDKKGINITLELFYLMAKLNNILFTDDKKQLINKMWFQSQALESIWKNLKKENQEKLEDIKGSYENRIDTIKNNYENDLVRLKETNKSVENEKKESEAKVLSLEANIGVLNDSINEYKGKLQKLTADTNHINELYKDVLNKKSEIELLLNREKQKYLKNLEQQWSEENKKKINERENIKNDIQKLEANLQNMRDEEKRLEGRILRWNQQIDGYFEHLDEKILNHKIESVFINKILPNVIGEDKNTKDGTKCDLFVQVSTLHEKVEKYSNFDDLLDLVSDNLAYVGIHKHVTREFITDVYLSANLSNLVPLFCGYRAIEVAKAVVAATDAEIPAIITVPTGFTDIVKLSDAITSVSSKNVIITDVFGKMNESIIVPLLRNKINKHLIFVAESMEDLKYMPFYMFYYLQLIVFKCKKVDYEYTFKYSNAREFFGNIPEDGNGFKIFRGLLKRLDVDDTYIECRKKLFNVMRAKNSAELENDILEQYIRTELKWILDDDGRKKLKQYLEENADKYNQSTIESVD